MITTESSEKNQVSPLSDSDGVSLIDIATTIGQEKRTILKTAFVFLLVGLGISLLQSNIYTAKTTILPPQQSQSGAANALASLGGLAGLAGGSLGIKSPDELYVAILQSETLQNNLIERYKLQKVYKQEKLSDTRNMLSSLVKVKTDKKAGIITIEVDDKLSNFAAQLANGYVDELRKLLDHLAVTDAQQRRVFFEKQILKTKDELAVAELKAKNAQETSGIISLEGQAAAAIKAAAELRAQIALREVKIQEASSYATAQNADVQRLAAELAGLRVQLDKLEKGTSQNPNNDKSESALANLRAFRDVKYQEAVLETLIKQYELARVEEAKDGPLIQQLDVATPPEKKSKPNRAFITILAAISGLILGILTAFIRRALRNAAIDPASAESLKLMRQAWLIKTRGK
jgi:tyrosine-protein kinase Etk/Wzc